jgi:preprotein translocase subunit SecE
MPRRRSLWRAFALILGLIVLTIAVFYAIGYALAKAIV